MKPSAGAVVVGLLTLICPVLTLSQAPLTNPSARQVAIIGKLVFFPRRDCVTFAANTNICHLANNAP